MDYRGFLFDFFGVICTDSHVVWLHENGFGNRIEELIEKYYQYADVGKISQSELFAKMGQLVGRDAEIVEKEVRSYITIDTEIVLLINELHARYRIGLCSNAPLGYAEEIMRDHDLYKYFDAVTISSAVGLRKPHPDMYKKAIDAMDMPAESVVFIDNEQANIDGAAACGIKSILFKSTAQLKNDLRLFVPHDSPSQ